MKKIVIHEPVIVAQSTTEPIMWGGYQDPHIRCGADKIIYVMFNARHDKPETFGLEDRDPVYASKDGGITWEKSTRAAWVGAAEVLPNGEKYTMREHSVIKLTEELPPIPENRIKTKQSEYASINIGTTYTVDELYPIFGEKIAKSFNAERVAKGGSEATTEVCPIRWKNMPIQHQRDFLWRITPTSDGYKVDKNGRLWMTVYGGYVADDGSMLSEKNSLHLLRSDDFGRSWDYVSTIPYKNEYNPPEADRWVEGFDEATIEFAEDGSMVVIMRSGSLYPNLEGKPYHFDYPIPKPYMARSVDEGKTWCEIKPFYDYGIRPHSVKLDCGTIIVISGRPGVYIRATHDPKAEVWEDIIPVLSVPEGEVYARYQYHSCSNCDICGYDENTAYITYSDFTKTAPDGKKAKSIMVSKVTVEEE